MSDQVETHVQAVVHAREDFRKRLLYDAGVAVLADIHFGSRVAGDGEHVRFSYASSLEAIAVGE